MSFYILIHDKFCAKWKRFWKMFLLYVEFFSVEFYSRVYSNVYNLSWIETKCLYDSFSYVLLSIQLYIRTCSFNKIDTVF